MPVACWVAARVRWCSDMRLQVVVAAFCHVSCAQLSVPSAHICLCYLPARMYLLIFSGLPA